MNQTNLQQIKEQVKKAESFQQQGNFGYAKRCYIKTILLLKEILKQVNDLNTTKIIKQKILKYTDQAKRMQSRQNQKQQNLSKLGANRFTFPQVISPKMQIQQNKKKIQQINDNKMEIEKPQKNNNLKSNKPKINPTNNIQQKPIEKHKIIKKNENKPKSKILQQLDPDIQALIVKESKVTFNDIIGMQQMKEILTQAVILPKKRPDLFQGIRAPPRGLLFYGPPGNGKTYIAKALANQAKCTFFAVSASAIMGKWVGESQRMLKKLFKSAQSRSPSIIFIDEIDSLLTQRSQKQNEASRRVKTQFLTLMDGMMSAKDGDVLLIGATNLPTQLDLAVLRRFNQLIYVGLPDSIARQGIILSNINNLNYNLSKSDMKILNKQLQGYSASQIKDIVKLVAMLPLKDISKSKFETIKQQTIRPINLDDFLQIIKKKKPLLSKQDLKKYQGNFI